MILRLLALALLTAPALADTPFDWGFSEGLTPVRTGREASGADCIGCHEDQAERWQHSRHRAAHDNPIYQSGLVDEPSPFCVHCHAPLPEQSAEVLANLRHYVARDPSRGLQPRPRLPEPLAAEGVNCVACHVRDGQILATNADTAEWAPHGITATPALSDGSLCEGCHDFHMPIFEGGSWILTDEIMQGTTSEWRAWRAAGGTERCVDCHMPAGDHAFRGAYDLDFVRGAVAVTRDGRTLTLTSTGVGHALPTGDLFRNLTVDARVDGRWSTVHRIGRTFEEVQDPLTLAWSKHEVADTSLQPGEPRAVALPESAARWRIRMHYGSDADEHRERLTDAELYADLWQGEL